MKPSPRSLASAAVVLSSVAVPVLTRNPRLLRFLATTSTATTMGLSLAHALERPGKLRLPIDQWWHLANRLYRPWFGRAGHAEGVALVVLPALAATDPRARREVMVGWLLLLVANPGIFMTMVAPTNRATLRSPLTPPRDAERLRDRWELGHLLRLGCHLSTFVLLIWPVTRATPGRH